MISLVSAPAVIVIALPTRSSIFSNARVVRGGQNRLINLIGPQALADNFWTARTSRKIVPA